MSLHVVRLDRYWLKGAGGKETQALEVDPALGVLGRGRYAIERVAQPGKDGWRPKAAFYVGQNTPRMVAERPVYNPEIVNEDGTSPPTDKYLHGLAERLGLEKVSLVDTGGGYYNTDTMPPVVHILNLRTVHEFGDFLGIAIDVHRFRADVWVYGDDLPPFVEYAWVDAFETSTRTIDIGGIPFRAYDWCERCKAINANPKTGTRDLDLLDALERFMKYHGQRPSPQRGVYTVMGVLMRPMKRGFINRGDLVRV